MKVTAAQLNFYIGNFDYNTSKIIQAIAEAKQQHSDLVVFPEMAVCGYPPRDFLEFPDFINKCNLAVAEIARHTENIAVIVGAPTVNPEIKGKNLFNTAFFLYDGKVQSTHHKSLLPNYDVFDEYRYFEPNRQFSIIEFKGHRIALTVCEDLWNVNNDPMYIMNPMDELMKLNPTLMVNIAASPFNYRQHEIRKNILATNTARYQLPLIYVNQTGAQTELIFDGGSMMLNQQGDCIFEAPFFTECCNTIELSEKTPVIQKLMQQSETELIYHALVLGVKDYFGKMGFKKAILGLSGGIDSAVTMAIAAEALGCDNVLGLLMPSEFSSEHSVNDAVKLAQNLGCPYEILPISNVYDATNQSLHNLFMERSFDLTEENIQARIRAVFLMAVANKFGYILLNTSNKSEAAVGYGTLYGDMCGGISVLGDVYKTQVYELARFINSTREVIPENTIIKPPSAELRPNQKDSDSLPEYDVLDKLLFHYIEECKGPEDLIALKFHPDLVARVLKLVNTSEYKRHQSPPILRISQKAFGMGRRMPIVGKYLS